MTAQPWEPSVARLEGAFEQIDRRLGAVEGRLETIDQKIEIRFEALERKLTDKIDGLDRKLTGRIDGLDRRIDGLDRKIDALDLKFDSKIDGNFKTTIKLMMGQTAATLAALAAVAFTLHH
jgi:hypothetical protein